MVIDSLQPIMSGLIVFSAGLAAIMGIVVLESFFRNKLKELFSDSQYFIFFFLVMGYVLYAIGEVAYFLLRRVLGDSSLVSIQDLYWTGGALVILLSFIALTINLFHAYPDRNIFLMMVGLGAGLLIVISYLLFGLIAREHTTLFNYLYVILSTLIVTFSLGGLLYSQHLANLGRVIVLFFFASFCILAGDILFSHTIGHNIYGLLPFFTDLFYFGGYSLSSLAFVSFLRNMHSQTFLQK